VVYDVAAIAGRTPTLSAIGAAVLLDRLPATVNGPVALVMLTFNAPPVFVRAVVPLKIEELTA